MQPLLTVNEVANFLKVRPKTVHEWVRRQRLACVQLSPKDRRFTEAHIQTFIESRTLPAAKLVDKEVSGSVLSTPQGGDKRKSTRVSEAGVSPREEIRRLCQ